MRKVHGWWREVVRNYFKFPANNELNIALAWPGLGHHQLVVSAGRKVEQLVFRPGLSLTDNNVSAS